MVGVHVRAIMDLSTTPTPPIMGVSPTTCRSWYAITPRCDADVRRAVAVRLRRRGTITHNAVTR